MPFPKFKIRRDTVWPFVLAGTITWSSGYPAALPPGIEWISPDKIGHFAAYGALATAIIRHPSLVRWTGPGLPPSPFGLWRTGWWALPLASLYGLGDEFRQSLNYYRSYDLADWAADTLGATVAVALYLRWPSYRRLLERPVWKKHPKTQITESPKAVLTTNEH